MGRIKTTLVKRTAEKLIDKQPELFNEDFENNKKVLGSTMPSKRIRNKIAGYIGRLKKNNKNILEENIVTQ
jgi:small subunit ribosomal protein S17e